MHSVSTEGPAFPMHVISIVRVLMMDQIACHEDLVEQEVLELWDGMAGVLFISHCWQSYTHPDPAGLKWQLLRSLLKGIVAATVGVECMWFTKFRPDAPKDIPAADLSNQLRAGYVWMDYMCVPQKNRTTQARAIACLPTYVAQSAVFVVLAPAGNHRETGKVSDVRTWGTRAWCRLEQLANVLSPKPKATIVVESMSTITFQPESDFLLRPVHEGNLSVPEDLPALKDLAAKLVQQRQETALVEEDWLMFRMLETMKESIVGPGVLPQQATDLTSWMQRLRFKSPHDEQASGWTPLRFAAYAGDIGLATCLLDAKADVEAPLAKVGVRTLGLHHTGSTIFSGVSFMRDDPDMLQMLVSRRADPGALTSYGICNVNPICQATEAGRIKNIDFLFNNYRETTYESSIMAPWWQWALLQGQVSCFEHLVKNGYITAAEQDPDFRNDMGGGPLALLAIMQNPIFGGDVQLLAKIFDIGYNMNLPMSPPLLSKGFLVWTACRKMFYFKEKTADTFLMFHAMGHDSTPLMNFAFFGNVPCVRELIDRGASLEEVDREGRTALMMAAARGHELLVTELVAAKVGLEARDSWGRTALQWAALRGHRGVVQILQAAGDGSLEPVRGSWGCSLCGSSPGPTPIEQVNDCPPGCKEDGIL